MAKKHVFTVTLNEGQIVPVVSGKRSTSATNVASLFRRIAGGHVFGGATIDARQSAAAASGTVTLSSASGTVGATVNGVSVTVTASGGDTATATALAAAINASADALVSNHVSASSAAGVVTITAKQPGHCGNAITLASSGTGATASGARLTGGTDTLVSFNY